MNFNPGAILPPLVHRRETIVAYQHSSLALQLQCHKPIRRVRIISTVSENLLICSSDFFVCLLFQYLRDTISRC